MQTSAFDDLQSVTDLLHDMAKEIVANGYFDPQISSTSLHTSGSSKRKQASIEDPLLNKKSASSKRKK